jgi:hypothetical protein
MIRIGRWELFVARAFICGPWFRDLSDVDPEKFDRWYVVGDSQFRRVTVKAGGQ